MRIELVIFFIAGLVAFNIYTEGKYMKLVMLHKKYWQIAGIGFGALILCWILRKDPSRAKDMLQSTNNYLKYMPIDSGTASFISPVLNFAASQQPEFNRPVIALDEVSVGGGSKSLDGPKSLDAASGSSLSSSSLSASPVEGRVKRSVSETKKKFVAARQKWLCKECGVLLSATYEIDHIIRLDRGGSNNVDNLAALCPNCHRQKTMVENL